MTYFAPNDHIGIQTQFSRAAAMYDNHCQIGKKVIQQNIAYLLPTCTNMSEVTILDLGCGTGLFAKEIQHHLNTATIYQCDIAPSMASEAFNHNTNTFIADIHQLPIRKESFTHLVSHMALQWTHLSEELFTQLNSYLKPGGHALFAFPTQGTLHELSESFEAIGLKPPVNNFISNQKLTSLFSCINTIPTISEHHYTSHHADIIDLMRHFKSLGANHLYTPSGNMLTKQKLGKANSYYINRYGNNKTINASWNISFVQWRKAQ